MSAPARIRHDAEPPRRDEDTKIRLYEKKVFLRAFVPSWPFQVLG